MAKTKTEVSNAEMGIENVKAETSMVAQDTGSLVPSFLQGNDTRGLEGLSRDDLQMPRLAIAQAMSPQLIAGDPAFIEGLSQGQCFNTLTGEIYGRGPFEIVVVRRDKPRGIEFAPRSEGGMVKDFDVPLDDPRMQFRTTADGKREKPIATKFYDFIILMLPTKDMIALSFKSTGIKTARQLNALMQIRKQAIFAGRYTLTVNQMKNQFGTFFVFNVKNSTAQDNLASKPGWVSEDLYKYAAEVFDQIKDKEFKIDREPGSDDDEDPFAGDSKM